MTEGLVYRSLDKLVGRIQAFNIRRNFGRLIPEYSQRGFIVLH
ncbi:7872_t:CDS:2 [Funneliformis geosporum]|uniref:7872_t:CDS:1 n=1 Tax=Funneliformis geosporum TaxID=1117311 RepID=A0A9W4SHQ1_9GLOM|nr:7872_t:CDS:2 [Funneliformis geosporum]